MRVLGIDPGTATTGYGLVEYSKGGLALLDFGWVKTDKGKLTQDRLRDIYLQFLSIFRIKRPAVVAIERIFFSVNAKSAIGVAQAQGVIMLAAAKNKVPIFEFSPLEVKRVVSGNGWAKKEEMKKVVRRLLKFRSPRKQRTHFDDVADALAVAICYIKKIDKNY